MYMQIAMDMSRVCAIERSRTLFTTPPNQNECANIGQFGFELRMKFKNAPVIMETRTVFDAQGRPRSVALSFAERSGLIWLIAT